MNSKESIQAVLYQLEKAIFPKDVFGDPSNLRKQFAYLAQIVHADHAEPNAKDLANQTFDKLVKLRDAAEVAISNKTYNEPILNFNHVIGSYKIDSRPWKVGEFSKLYRAENNLLIKVAAKPAYNKILEKEVIILKKAELIPGIANTLPKVINSFYLTEKSKRFRITVMPFNGEYKSISDILQHFPNSLDPKHSAWIIRRVIAAQLTASMLGFTHNTTLDHVLVHPITHDPLYVGWASQKQSVTLGQTILKILGPNAPKELINIASSKKSPSNLLAEFTAAVRKLWGKQYVPLILSNGSWE